MKTRARCILGLALIAVVCLLGGRPIGARGAVFAPVGIDLDVTTISRSPTYHRYCVTYENGVPLLCSGTEGEQRWPNPGETVTFTAHIVNKGSDPSGSFAYTWAIDAAPVYTGTVPGLAAGAEITVTTDWVWDHDLDGERLLGQHTVGFTADSLDEVSETFEQNNQRTDRTDGLSLVIFFEQSLYDELEGAANGVGTYSSEDWIQWQVAQMNQRLAQAVYPTSPQGALSRVRIDHIQVCTDVSACMAAHDPLAWDGRWQFRYTSDYVSRFATQIDWGLIHELAHQIGVIDLYQMDVADWMNRVPDRSGDPLWCAIGWPNAGRMGGGDTTPYNDGTYFSSHTAGGLNANHGYRRGYYGEYLFDVPLTTTLVILDGAGQPVPDAEVALFQKQLGDYGLPPSPTISGQTGDQGAFTLPDRPAQGHTTTATGHTLRDTPFGYLHVVGKPGLFWGRIRARDHEEFFRYDITDANLAYWSGLTETHRITLTTHIPPLDGPTAPPRMRPLRIENSQVTLAWSPSPSGTVTGYHVYRAGRPDWVYQRVVTATTALSHTETFPHSDKYHYAVTAVDDLGRESGFSPVARVPHLVRPWGIDVNPWGDRVIAERHHRRTLLQHSDGRFVGFFNRLSGFNGTGVDVSESGAILVSEPGRHCVYHLNSIGTVLGTIGDCADVSGQLDTPYDAVFGVAAAYPSPVPNVADEQTLLLCHFNGGTTCVDGEIGAGMGITFTTGHFGQGILVTDTATLTYPSAGNIVPDQGTIEFWLQPGWDGDDHRDYVFFETSGGWYNRIRIAKDGANNLRFLTWDGTNEYSLGTSVNHWRAGEWHHVGAMWTMGHMWLVVDGAVKAARTDNQPPETLGGVLTVGSNQSAGQQANAVIDELHISDVPRFVNTPFAFVVDTGRHQVQAIGDGQETVATFGGYGSGPGQFSSPQGIAAAPGGRVIVADTDNDRLQVLSYDGSTFTVTQIITAGMSGPRDVAVDGWGRIAVADSGNNLVRLFNPDGTLRETFDRPDSPYSGPFNDPCGVAVERLDRIVVNDTGNWRVVTVTIDMPRVYLPLVLQVGP
jgi:hypothetical protein